MYDLEIVAEVTPLPPAGTTAATTTRTTPTPTPPPPPRRRPPRRRPQTTPTTRRRRRRRRRPERSRHLRVCGGAVRRRRSDRATRYAARRRLPPHRRLGPSARLARRRRRARGGRPVCRLGCVVCYRRRRLPRGRVALVRTRPRRRDAQRPRLLWDPRAARRVHVHRDTHRFRHAEDWPGRRRRDADDPGDGIRRRLGVPLPHRRRHRPRHLHLRSDRRLCDTAVRALRHAAIRRLGAPRRRDRPRRKNLHHRRRHPLCVCTDRLGGCTAVVARRRRCGRRRARVPLWRRTGAFSWCWFGTDLDGTGRVPASYANGGAGDGSDDMPHCDAPAAKEAGVALVRVSLDNLAEQHLGRLHVHGLHRRVRRAVPARPARNAATFPNASSPPPLPPSEPPAPGLPPSLPLVGIAETQDRRAARRLRISPSSGPSGGGTPLTVTGNGLTGGDGYRCRFGTMRSPWRAAASNVVDATFVDANTLHCGADAAAAAATAILWRDFMDPLSRNGARRRALLIRPPPLTSSLCLSRYPSGHLDPRAALSPPPARRPSDSLSHPSSQVTRRTEWWSSMRSPHPIPTIHGRPHRRRWSPASAQARRGAAATWRSPRLKTAGGASVHRLLACAPPAAATAGDGAVVAAAAGSGRAPSFITAYFLTTLKRAHCHGRGSPSCSTRRDDACGGGALGMRRSGGAAPTATPSQRRRQTAARRRSRWRSTAVARCTSDTAGWCTSTLYNCPSKKTAGRRRR